MASSTLKKKDFGKFKGGTYVTTRLMQDDGDKAEGRVWVQYRSVARVSQPHPLEHYERHDPEEGARLRRLARQAGFVNSQE